MERVTGVGGVFIKAEDPEGLYAWYEKHLGMKRGPEGAVVFRDSKGITIWSLFPKDTKYFGPSRSSVMMNYRVENLDALLEALRAEGVEIDPRREDYEYGRFAWIMDLEGNRIELWEPAPAPQET